MIDALSSSVIRVGLISDTHGLLRPEAMAFLRGSDYVVHAGDIGASSVLEELAEIAPLTAVRGNNDKAPWAAEIPNTATLKVGAVLICVIHDLSVLAVDPRANGFRVVVTGHTHRPLRTERDGVLFVNPGSAGPRRFSLPVSLGELVVARHRVEARLHTVELTAAPGRRRTS